MPLFLDFLVPESKSGSDDWIFRFTLYVFLDGFSVFTELANDKESHFAKVVRRNIVTINVKIVLEKPDA